MLTTKSYTPSQRNALRHVLDVTQTNERTALKLLKSCQWNSSLAIDHFYNKKFNTSVVVKIFEQYAEPGEDKIGLDGTIRYLQDLGLDVEEKATLVLAWKLGSPTTGEFNKEQFIEGWRSLECDSFDAMKGKIPIFRKWILEDEQTYHKVYLYVFGFAKTPGQKSLGLDTAIDYWELLLRDRFEHLDLWIQFLKEKHGRAISKDTWNQLWDFMKCYDKTFQIYDEDGAWPVLIDEFVEYARTK